MIELRSYMPDDCNEIIRLFYGTVHTVNAKDYTKAQLDAWAPETLDAAAWNQSFLEHETLVAEEAGKIVGFGDIDSRGYLDRLYVHKDFQGRGIATALCSRLEGAHPRVETHASVTARPFFEKRGYKVAKEQTVFRKGEALINYVMVKEG